MPAFFSYYQSWCLSILVLCLSIVLIFEHAFTETPMNLMVQRMRTHLTILLGLSLSLCFFNQSKLHEFTKAVYPLQAKGDGERDRGRKEYLPPTIDWVRKQVEVYEATNGEKGYTLLDTGMPCIIVTHVGRNTGAIRKIPLMRVKSNDSYVLIGSMGGQPQDPVWVYNLRARSDVEIRDKDEVSKMVVREVTDPEERRGSGISVLQPIRPTPTIRLKRSSYSVLAEPAKYMSLQQGELT